MNRKQKIIVSVTGIFIVLLILVGLTYAYFLTRINGNTNTKSISVNTKFLEVTYSDDSSVITANNIGPNTTLDNKTFTVTNTGEDDAEYVVVLDNVSIKDKNNNTTTFESNDFVYTLTCTSSVGSCESITNETTLPLVNNGILIGNKISKNVVHTYTLSITYKETGNNQSNDMGKTLEMRVNINDIKEINPYSSNTNSLAYNVINNAMTLKNGTELRATPLTKPAQDISSSTEKELSLASDDYGNSYYYRGGVEDNYLNFAGMCWRIVRIEGDGSIKIILEDSTYECNDASFNGNWSIGNTIIFGYDSNSKADFLGYSGGLADSLETYQTTLNTKIGTKYSGKTLSDYLKVDEWCYDHNVTEYKYWDNNFNELPNSTGAEYIDEYYGAYTRLVTNKQPSLNCTGTKINKFRDNTDMYVGTLTADEIALAGAKSGAYNYTYYLLNSYAKTNHLYWWALSPVGWIGEYIDDYAFRVSEFGDLYDYHARDDYFGVARSVVSLKSSTEILSGEGTQSNPYVIK